MITLMYRVSIVIPAYNEERNIALVLSDIFRQQFTTLKLVEIMVISDGCEKTSQAVKRITHPLLRTIHHNARRGKSVILNEISTTLSTDILVELDADVRLISDTTLETLLKPLCTDTTLNAVCGMNTPFPSENITQKAISHGITVINSIKDDLGPKAIRHRFIGRMCAMRVSAIRSRIIPPDVGTDTFTFYYLIKQGQKIRFIPEAQVHYRLPATAQDFIKQTKRYLRTNSERYFAPSLLKKYEVISVSRYLPIVVIRSIRHPLLASYFLILYIISHIQAYSYTRTSLWDIIPSTKIPSYTQ